MNAAVYRVRQARKAWRGALTREEREEVAAALDPGLFRVFLAMGPLGQRHGYNVYRTLRSQRHRDRDLLAAGLLHDAGKGRLGLLSRTFWVLLGAWRPDLRDRWARRAGWGRLLGLAQNLRHAEVGAEAVRQAGGSATLVRLVRDHKSPAAGDPRLAALQRADNEN